MKVAVKEAFDCLDEIRALFLEYAADLECSLDFQDFEAEIANLPYKYAKMRFTPNYLAGLILRHVF